MPQIAIKRPTTSTPDVNNNYATSRYIFFYECYLISAGSSSHNLLHFIYSKTVIVRCRYAPNKGGSKTQNGRFRCNIALRLKKVCYKISLCEVCQRNCKAFIGLTIRAKNDGWAATPFTWNFWSNLPRWSEIADFYRAAWNADAV